MDDREIIELLQAMVRAPSHPGIAGSSRSARGGLTSSRRSKAASLVPIFSSAGTSTLSLRTRALPQISSRLRSRRAACAAAARST